MINEFSQIFKHKKIYAIGFKKIFSDKEKTILKEWLPDAASVANPIDIIWDATSKTYSQILINLKEIVFENAVIVNISRYLSYLLFVFY